MAGWSTVDYSNEDLISMQKEAERRVREMQRQAKAVLMNKSIEENEAKAVEVPNPPQKENVVQNNQFTRNNKIAHNNQGVHNNQRTNKEASPQKQPAQEVPPVQNMPIREQNNNSSQSGNKKKTGLLGNLLTGDLGNLQGMLSGFLKNSKDDTPIGKIISALNIDSEKLMLIFLILLLLNEGEDYSLILALGYILL